MMLKIKEFSDLNLPSSSEKQELIDFLFNHLEEFGDPWSDIEKSIDFALKIGHSFGGFILEAIEDGQIVCAIVLNQTGMKDYIPENILVYIATHKEKRGRGYAKKLLQQAIDKADGNIALHVEPNNPAKFLYEKLGFTNKYLEMRHLKKR
jgi:[ribosomal protein S18]-alanine N-acetyltransferase